MVVVISCSHFPDDERIYHKEINTILEEGYFVKYFTFAESIIDINDKNIIYINYEKQNLNPIDAYLCGGRGTAQSTPR